MASSAWEWIKRNKGKAVVIGSVAAAGVAVLANRAWDQAQGSVEDAAAAAAEEEHLAAMRRSFVFDAHQETSDKALVDSLLPLVRNAIMQRYNVDAVVADLKASGHSNDEKIALWSDLRVKTFARIVAVAFGYTLTTIASKAGKSIVCAEVCKLSEKKQQPDFWNTVTEAITKNIFGTAYKPTTNDNGSAAQVQQVFVNCVHFLTTSGLNQLLTKLEAVVADVVTQLGFAQRISAKEIASALYAIVDRFLAESSAENFANFIVPTAAQPILPRTELEQLITRFATVLKLPSTRSLIEVFATAYVSRAADALATEEEQPLAQLLPRIADVFIVIQNFRDRDSVFQECLRSRELHHFAQVAFKAP